MLRISLAWQDREEIGLKVEGRLEGEEVALLAAEGEHWLEEGKGLVLELEGLRSVDAAGAALLLRWGEAGVTWRGASMFVQTLLRDYGVE